MKYLNNDTIAALSSAAGKAAIAIIRISGPDAFEVLSQVFKSRSTQKSRVQFGYIVDGEQKIDEVLCIFFKAPYSYTGEDIVEINVHGNPIIIAAVLELLFRKGIRQAEGGEFTYRAFINGKKDLSQAESVCDLITSKTALSAKSALNNLDGIFSERIKNIKENILEFLTFLEASLDYPDEDDVPFLTPTEKLQKIQNIKNTVVKLASNFKVSKILKNGLKMALIGKPNVGKSSILNAVVGKNRAIVTEIEGTTTDAIEESIDCRGIALTIIDTAGIREQKADKIEVLGQEKTRETAQRADIIVWVLDISRPLDNNDFEIAKILQEIPQTTIFILLNKSDLPSKLDFDFKNLKSGLKIEQELKVCALSGEGISCLLDEIAKMAGLIDNQNDYLMLNARHWDLLTRILATFENIESAISDKNADEIACGQLRQALSFCDEILGIDIETDILDSIFSTFCIGK